LGGVFFGQYASALLLERVTSDSNVAIQFGGVFLTSVTPVTLRESTFGGNRAAAGGVYFWLDGPRPEVLSDCVFTANQAPYGYGDVQASSLASVLIASQAFLEANTQSLGLGLSPTLSVIALDQFNQTMSSLLFATASIERSDPSSAAVSGTLSRPFVRGVASFDDLIVVAHSTTTVRIVATASPSSGNIQLETSFVLSANASCRPGAYLTSTQCAPCLLGRYSSVVNTKTECDLCPSGRSYFLLFCFVFHLLLLCFAKN
jgi:hypothetical protein